MSGWIAAAALAALTFALIALVLRAPRVTWTAILAALVFGLAGYALQGRPELAGTPREAQERALGDPETAIALRHALAGAGASSDSSALVTADAFARHGQNAEAAGILLGAVDKQPKDAQAWLALGNALVAHADGALTPAALYAYRRADAAVPNQPGPAFFLGLALAQNGRFAEARAHWGRAMAYSPPDAPWKPELARNMARLDRLIAAQAAARAGQSGEDAAP